MESTCLICVEHVQFECNIGYSTIRVQYLKYKSQNFKTISLQSDGHCESELKYALDIFYIT